MYANQYEEHIAHSAYDHAEQFAGFDRAEPLAQCSGTDIVGRMRSESGARVEIVCAWYVSEDFDRESFAVLIDGEQVSDDYDTKEDAAKVARWWLDGCPPVINQRPFKTEGFILALQNGVRIKP